MRTRRVILRRAAGRLRLGAVSHGDDLGRRSSHPSTASALIVLTVIQRIGLPSGSRLGRLGVAESHRTSTPSPRMLAVLSSAQLLSSHAARPVCLHPEVQSSLTRRHRYSELALRLALSPTKLRVWRRPLARWPISHRRQHSTHHLWVCDDGDQVTTSTAMGTAQHILSEHPPQELRPGNVVLPAQVPCSYDRTPRTHPARLSLS